MFASLNLDNLVAKFRSVNSLTEGEAQRRFLGILAEVTGKHPRLSIIGVRIAKGTVRIKIQNNVVFRFEEGSPVPIQEIPPEKRGRNVAWFKRREAEEKILETIARFEVLVESIRAKNPAVFRNRNRQNASYDALCQVAQEIYNFFWYQQRSTMSQSMLALETRFRDMLVETEVRVAEPVC